MTHIAKQRLIPALALFMAVLFLISCFAPTINAAGQAHNDENSKNNNAVINLVGREADGKYELTTKDLYLFSLENIAPGDSWQGSVKVNNQTDSDMAVSVYSITSTLGLDTALFEVLDLRISVAGDEGYHGDYAAGKNPVTGYYPIPSGEDLNFDIEVFFPGTAGNEYQGKQMDSTWTFDAVYYEPENSAGLPSNPSSPSGSDVIPQDEIIKTGMDLTGANTGLITSLVIFVLSLVAAGITYSRYHGIKKAQQAWAEKNKHHFENLEE